MASYIRRRKFLATLLGGAAAALPLAVRARNLVRREVARLEKQAAQRAHCLRPAARACITE